MRPGFAWTLPFALTAAGCVVLPRPATGPALPPVTAAFVPADHSAFMGPGSGSMTGQAFLRQRGGAVVTCAGARVYAHPSTPFFAQAVAYTAAGGSLISVPGGTASQALVRQSLCDAQGNFEFSELPPGRWIVTVTVRWSGAGSEQGGLLAQTVTVGDGVARRILLTGEDLIGLPRGEP
jgi:hypothetical protein